VDPATGQALTHQAIQGMPTSTMSYDVFGRLIGTTTPGTQAIDVRLRPCTATNCVLQRETWQAGSPAKVEYLDRLGRTLAQGVQGFDGNEIVSQIAYNARGAKVTEYPPASTGAGPGSWSGSPSISVAAYATTYSGIDALGRVLTKAATRDPSIFLGTSGTATMTTTYQYGVIGGVNTTTIHVTTPTTNSGMISMSRSYDGRGKLAQTTQSVGSSVITTTYGWDPAGHVTDITDTANHTLHADYDEFGRKTQMRDPDRGTWNFSWDGLARLRTQEDARGIQQAYQYDAIGRMEHRFMLRPGDPAWLLEAQWVYDQNGSMGTLSAMYGALDTEAGSLNNLAADSFQRAYFYDSSHRPTNILTHLPWSSDVPGRDFQMEYAYDGNYGRPKAILYPGGEMATFSYKDRGQLEKELQLLPDGTAGTVGTAYRTVNSMSPRGQITSQLFGNGVSETAVYDTATGMARSLGATGLNEHTAGCSAASAPKVRDLSYSYDQFLNLAQQSKTLYRRDTAHAIQFSAGCAPLTETVSEAYQYDELQRLTGATRTWPSDVAVVAPTTGVDSYSYDLLGNITGKSDYADTYVYGGSGPHQVTQVKQNNQLKASFTYDPNGNLINGDGRVLEYDNFDRPVTVTMNGTTVKFRYAPDGSRYQQITLNASGAVVSTEHYVDKSYEQIEDNVSIEGRTHVSDVVEIVQKATRSVRYRHLDRLGSLEAATTEASAEDTAYEHGFDAFGSPRSRDWQSSGDLMGQTDERGFTGHEHLDNLRLIHMNGRVYDYKLGRFLSVDPFVSTPVNSQSINPYSYIGNNPLNGVDPTGYLAANLSPVKSACGSNVGSHCDTIQIGGPNASDKPMMVVHNGQVFTFYYVPGTNKALDQALSAATQAATQPSAPDGGQQSASGQQEVSDSAKTDAPDKDLSDKDKLKFSVISKTREFSMSERDKVAKAKLDEVNQLSKIQHLEYGGLIIINMANNNKVEASKAITGESGTEVDPFDAAKLIREPALVIGEYHTHGGYSMKDSLGNVFNSDNPRMDRGSNQMSGPDIDGISDQFNKNYHFYRGYLSTPSTKIYYYDATTKEPRQLH
jgi:RHS repeat-associated protein